MRNNRRGYESDSTGGGDRFRGQVKPPWIGDEQFVLQRCGSNDARDHVYQTAIVGDAAFHIGVRPVGAPQHAVPWASTSGATVRTKSAQIDIKVLPDEELA